MSREVFRKLPLYFPEKTAIARSKPSVLANFLVNDKFINNLGSVKRILDYGCGRGVDVNFYNNKGFNAYGYDPYEPYGFSKLPKGNFDLVTVVFVLNVLASTTERQKLLKKVFDLTKTKGNVVVATRSEWNVNRKAKKLMWEPHNDGYWSSVERKTFQKGMTETELIGLSTNAGFKVHPINNQMLKNQDSTYLLLQKPTI